MAASYLKKLYDTTEPISLRSNGFWNELVKKFFIDHRESLEKQKVKLCEPTASTVVYGQSISEIYVDEVRLLDPVDILPKEPS